MMRMTIHAFCFFRPTPLGIELYVCGLNLATEPLNKDKGMKMFDPDAILHWSKIAKLRRMMKFATYSCESLHFSHSVSDNWQQ